MNTTISLLPPFRDHIRGSTKKLKHILSIVIVFAGVMLAVDSARSQFAPTPVPGLPGVSAGSVAWGDYDNDGLLDFLLEGLSGNTFTTQLWRNTGNGFTLVSVPGLAGIADGSLAWADYDNDGRLDFLITGLTNGATEVSELWRNTASGFTNVPVPGPPGNFDNALARGDFDNDGRLDFLVAGPSVATWSHSSGATPASRQTLRLPRQRDFRHRRWYGGASKVECTCR